MVNKQNDFQLSQQQSRQCGKKIADCIDLQDCIADLEPQVATFLSRYLSDPQFPQSKNEIPEEAIGSGVKALSISISPHRDYGPSAYPLMICKVLNGTPKTQTVIIQAVQEKYGTKIDRKAVSRHLELLGALGFRVQKRKDGYYLGE
jgi:hypothetical protein